MIFMYSESLDLIFVHKPSPYRIRIAMSTCQRQCHLMDCLQMSVNDTRSRAQVVLKRQNYN